MVLQKSPSGSEEAWSLAPGSAFTTALLYGNQSMAAVGSLAAMLVCKGFNDNSLSVRPHLQALALHNEIHHFLHHCQKLFTSAQ